MHWQIVSFLELLDTSLTRLNLVGSRSSRSFGACAWVGTTAASLVPVVVLVGVCARRGNNFAGLLPGRCIFDLKSLNKLLIAFKCVESRKLVGPHTIVDIFVFLQIKRASSDGILNFCFESLAIRDQEVAKEFESGIH